MTVQVRAATDLGLRRAHNEDRLGVWIGGDAEVAERGVLMIVADGMGGASGGEIASQLAVDCVMRHYRESSNGIAEDLKRSIQAANRAIHDHGRAVPELSGMGTTCTALVVRGDEGYFAHVGDSRAYLVRDGAIHQLTHDHSLVAQLVLDRHLTPEQAKVDPRRNVVTRSVGVGAEVEVDAARLGEPVRAGDTLVLCTDGLHGLVADDEIARLASQADLERACHELITLARERGGFDNITAVIGRRDP